MKNLIVISVNNEVRFATLDKGIATRVIEEMERGAVNPNHPIEVKELEPHLDGQESWL